jgi:hypothetical protein
MLSFRLGFQPLFLRVETELRNLIHPALTANMKLIRFLITEKSRSQDKMRTKQMQINIY